MGAEPSVTYVIEPENGEIYAYNPLFPNMRVELSEKVIDDMGFDEVDTNLIKQVLLEEYMKKYGN